MKKIKLSKNFYQYQFPPFEGQHFGFNIYVLIDGNDALLIDTAFENHAQAVSVDLEKSGVKVKEVVFSHFHPDHISGISALNAPKLFGSALYQQTLNKYTPTEKHHFFNDMNIISEQSLLPFGQFNLRFNLVQGHVPCGIFTIVNDSFVHVADDIMTSNKGEPILPSVQCDNAQDHIDSLERLKQYSSHTLLLSHGNAITGETEILTAIECRQNYLRAIVGSNEPLSIEDAIKDCDCDFLQQDWHNYVYS